ncbi:Ldh family oxidoreductase [Georgenia ruanii]|uniref:Ldh family oxidoreductase n=1 Tax=Georgenia ruanii TaxID=348442 RepID=A0A7J9UWW4_9MICO|nr:Ldh family oxidoreductase [Georgenia ruanii]MPV89107.1 Ldh family oxidoreductase [Georgenia ruanii]
MSAHHVSAEWLRGALSSVFRSVGFSDHAAGLVAESLVEADMSGVPSHGSMLLPMYVDRLLGGSVSTHEQGEVVEDFGAVAVLDGRHALGQLTGHQAMGLALDKAHRYGLGAVAVRHAFHFGRAANYTEMAAERGCIGLATSNTRPLMPAVGGAQPVVGNNPLAIAIPGNGGPVMSLDMALSEAAMGKIRIAEAEGRPIPDTWATDADGELTTDPTAAIAGMLLPTGGPKGFGLALVIDVLSGVLSGGAFGAGVQPLYKDATVPYDCAHFFLAIDPALFGPGFDERVAALAAEVTGSRARPGVERIMLPGQPEAERRHRAETEGIEIDATVMDGILRVAERVGAQLPAGPLETTHAG